MRWSTSDKAICQISFLFFFFLFRLLFRFRINFLWIIHLCPCQWFNDVVYRLSDGNHRNTDEVVHFNECVTCKRWKWKIISCKREKEFFFVGRFHLKTCDVTMPPKHSRTFLPFFFLMEIFNVSLFSLISLTVASHETNDSRFFVYFWCATFCFCTFIIYYVGIT